MVLGGVFTVSGQAPYVCNRRRDARALRSTMTPPSPRLLDEAGGGRLDMVAKPRDALKAVTRRLDLVELAMGAHHTTRK